MVIPIFYLAVGMKVLSLIERSEEGEVVPVAVPLDSHVVGNTACTQVQTQRECMMQRAALCKNVTIDMYVYNDILLMFHLFTIIMSMNIVARI